MLDIKLIRENPELVKQGLQKKGFDPELVTSVVTLDEQRRTLQFGSEQLRAEQKKLDFTDESTRDRAKTLKEELQSKDEELRTLDQQFSQAMMELPNIPQDDVPVGEGESANTVLKTVGEKPEITNPVDHVTLGEKHDLFDIDRATKVAGSRFNYLKNEAVILEFALVRFAFDLAMKHGHTPMITPELVNEKTVTGTGYLPHGADEVYKTQDDLYLIGTSELALVAYHQDEILAEDELPKRYVGFSSCFRREAGTYGKDTRGILRQHQFDKVELVSFVKPEESATELDRILGIEEELMQALQLPYHVLEIGTGDLGIQAAKKYDIETWLPGQDKYRETHSCSNTIDFQTRRLNVRYKKADGTNEFAHCLNGTAVAVGRMLIAILENCQQADGSIKIPEVLHKYTGFTTIA